MNFQEIPGSALSETLTAFGAIDFAALLDAAPHPYMLLDSGLRIVWANAAYLGVTGRSLPDIAGRTIFEAFPSGPHDPGGTGERELRASLERVLAQRQQDTLALIRYAISRATPAGSIFEERYWSATHTPIPDGNGGIRFILQQTDDVTELVKLRGAVEEDSVRGFQADMSWIERGVFQRAQAVQAENRSLDSELRHLRQLFQQAPGFIAFLRGPRHVFELANDAYYQVVGYRNIIGKPVREALPEISGQGYIELLDRVFETGEPFIGRDLRASVQRRPDGPLEQVIMDLVYQPIVGPGGDISGIFVQGNDVSERKAAQDQLERYRNRLEDLVRERTSALEKSEAERRHAEAVLRQAQKMESIGQLTGGVAHDFNNLLQVIGGNLQLLQRTVVAEEESRRLRIALSAVERGAKLASQLLAFARRQPLEPRSVNLGRLVRGMDDLLRRALGEEIEVETVIAGGLWNTLADTDQIENAIINLAVNARDAMDGHGKLTIEAGNAMLDDLYVAAHPDVTPGQYVILAVSDTGSGMTPEVVERAFDPFFTTKPEGRGTGLGLSMVYGFVKQSGGHLKIYSEVGHGTTVKIYLPRTHQPEEIVSDGRDAPITGGTETILVVEDDPDVRATVADMLRDLGYRVLKASDGQSALAVIESGVAIDILFTDVIMPGPVRSPDLARRAREILPDLTVLFTSGYTENAIVHGGRLDPGVHLLSKPYRREDLARKIGHLLQNHRQRTAQPVAVPVPTAAALRVLLVEDDFLIQLSTEDMLRELGHEVTAVADAEDALNELGRQRFDILFTDIALPGLSGIELARRATDLMPGIGVIIASGYGASGYGNGAGADPGAVILPKPYDQTGVEQALRKAREGQNPTSCR
jgi:signal transduction histidine kinase/CheY-like chemotaxis protein